MDVMGDVFAFRLIENDKVEIYDSYGEMDDWAVTRLLYAKFGAIIQKKWKGDWEPKGRYRRYRRDGERLTFLDGFSVKHKKSGVD